MNKIALNMIQNLFSFQIVDGQYSQDKNVIKFLNVEIIRNCLHYMCITKQELSTNRIVLVTSL